MVVGRAMAAAMAVVATPMATVAVAMVVAVAVAVAVVMAVAVAVAAAVAVAVAVVIPTPLRLQQPTVVLEGGWRGNACQVFKNTVWCLHLGLGHCDVFIICFGDFRMFYSFFLFLKKGIKKIKKTFYSITYRFVLRVRRSLDPNVDYQGGAFN